MKKIKYFHLLALIPFCIEPISLQQKKIINMSNHHTNKIKLHSGKIDDPNVTEEQKKAAQDQFWLEFGITAGVLGTIIIICLIIYFSKRRRK